MRKWDEIGGGIKDWEYFLDMGGKRRKRERGPRVRSNPGEYYCGVCHGTHHKSSRIGIEHLRYEFE